MSDHDELETTKETREVKHDDALLGQKSGAVKYHVDADWFLALLRDFARQSATIARLTRERDEAQEKLKPRDPMSNRDWRLRAEAAEADRDRLAAELEQAKGLLKPFADAADYYDSVDMADNFYPDSLGADNIQLVNFRAARAFLTPKENKLQLFGNDDEPTAVSS